MSWSRIDRCGGFIRNQIRIDTIYVGSILCIGLPLYLIGLGDWQLYPYDEGLYANTARYMVSSGEWLVPQLQVSNITTELSLSPRLIKPPLPYWLQALSIVAFGVNEFAVRLPATLAAIATGIVVFVIGRQIFDRNAGLASAFLLLVFPPVFHRQHGGRGATSDMLLVLFGTIFVWQAYRGGKVNPEDRPVIYVLGGIAAGLAILTKSFAAGVFLLVVLPFVLSNIRSYLHRWTAVAVGLTTGIGFLWPLYMALRYQGAFIEQFFAAAVVRRAAGELAVSNETALFGFMNYPYFIALPEFLWWQAALLVGAAIIIHLIVLVFNVKRNYSPPFEIESQVLLLWWFAAVPIAFALGGGNHDWYLLPCVVPAVLLVGFLPSVLYRKAVPVLEERVARISPYNASMGYLLAGICTILIITSMYPPMAMASSDKNWQEMGLTLNEQTSESTTIYVIGWPNRVRTADLTTVSFYSQRNFQQATPGRVERDPTITYVVTPADELDDIERSFTIIGNITDTDILIVRFEAPPEPAQITRN